MKFRNAIAISLSAALTVTAFVASSLGAGSVEWDVYKTLDIEAEPIDVAVSRDGQRLFILTENGKILIYSPTTGKQPDQIDVGSQIDQIKLGPRGDSLILTSRKNRTVQIVTLDFIQNINVSGSPFKGPENAPVVIAVFSDFQ